MRNNYKIIYINEGGSRVRYNNEFKKEDKVLHKSMTNNKLKKLDYDSRVIVIIDNISSLFKTFLYNSKLEHSELEEIKGNFKEIKTNKKMQEDLIKFLKGISSSDKEFENLQEINVLKQELEKLNALKKDKQETLNEPEQNVEEAQKENNVLKEEIKKLQKELDQKNEENKKALEEQKKENRESNLNLELIFLNQENQKLKLQNFNLDKEIKALEENVQKTNEEIEKALNKVEKANQEKEKALKEVVDTLNSTEENSLEEQKTELEAAFQVKTNQLEKVDVLEKEKSDSKNIKKTLEKTNTDLQKLKNEKAALEEQKQKAALEKNENITITNSLKNEENLKTALEKEKAVNENITITNSPKNEENLLAINALIGGNFTDPNLTKLLNENNIRTNQIKNSFLFSGPKTKENEANVRLLFEGAGFKNQSKALDSFLFIKIFN